MCFIVMYTESGKTGLQTLVNDKGKRVGERREFDSRTDAEAVAKARSLQKPCIIKFEKQRAAGA